MDKNIYAPKQSNAIEKLKEVYILEEHPSFKIVKDGIVLPRSFKGNRNKIPYQGLGGVVSASGEFVDESCIYDLIHSSDQKQLLAFGGAYPAKTNICRKKTAIYMGLANRHWGHFLIDVVQRCWFLLAVDLLQSSKGIKDPAIEIPKEEFNFIIPKDYILVFSGTGDLCKEFTGNHKDFFELLGVETDRIEFINEPTQFETVIVPDAAIYPGKYIYSVFGNIFNIVVKNAMEMIPKDVQRFGKIYFSRAHLCDPKDMGEENIELQMKKSGFEILYPEELTLKEQIFYWQTADEIACINGTIPHNCVFAHKNLKLYVFNKMERMVGYQFTMDAVWGGEPIYISAYKEPFKRYPLSVSRGPFWITITDSVIQFVKDQFDLTIEKKIKLSDYFRYFVLCIITELKYHLRGGRSKLKNIFYKIKKSK